MPVVLVCGGEYVALLDLALSGTGSADGLVDLLDDRSHLSLLLSLEVFGSHFTEVLDTLLELKSARHIAILLVSHDLRFVREYADHVVLLDKTVLCQGDPRDVFSSPEFDAVFGTGEEEEA